MSNVVEEPTSDETGGEESSEQERELARRLVELLTAGRKIEAVKAYREATGASLREAVEFVNGVAKEHGLSQPSGCSTSAAALFVVAALLSWLAVS